MKRRNMLVVALLVAGTLTPAAPAQARTLRTWCSNNAHLLEHADDIRAEFPDAPIMVRVSCCESQGNPRAVSRTGDYGLGQINWRSWARALRALGIADTPTDLFDPETGIAAMRLVYEEQGLRAWRPSRRCWG